MAGVREYRLQYKASGQIPLWYSGRVHYIGNIILVFVILAATLPFFYQSALAWLVFCLMFPVTHLVEYLAHRYPLHHPMKGVKLAYQEHTLAHHSYFSDEYAEIESDSDLHRVLFKPYAVGAFLGIVGGGLSLLGYFLAGVEVATAMFAAGASYFLIYETIHLVCHLPDSHWSLKLSPLKSMKRHHRLHHDPRSMNKNLGVVSPLFDRVFGTLRS